MTRTPAAAIHHNAKDDVLYMALELSAKTWVIRFGSSRAERQIHLPAWDQPAFQRHLRQAKTKLSLAQEARVLAVQEAGRDGFAVHRFLESLGLQSLVVDSAAIEVPRRRRHAKTDRLDAIALLRLLRRYAGGETAALPVIRVPTLEQETARLAGRERDRLVRQRTRVTNGIKSLLACHGCVVSWGRSRRRFAQLLPTLTDWRGDRFGAAAMAQLERALQRWTLLDEQIGAIESERGRALANPGCASDVRARRLSFFKGVGPTSSTLLAHDFFWRDFANRRQVASAAGLVPLAHQSGGMDRSGSISKAGNSRIRHVMIELSWRWLRYQPDSDSARWYQERYGSGSKRSRKVGIVALARRLLIDFWRYLFDGVVPAGAVLVAM